MRRSPLLLFLFASSLYAPLRADTALLDVEGPLHHRTGDYPHFVATGDFNEDGMTDVVTADRLDSTVTVLLGDTTGFGTFGAGMSYHAGVQPYGIAVADFDEDGILDLATANRLGDDVSILLGNGAGGVGDGTFGPAAHYLSGDGAYALVPGDFDEDGILDLAVINDLEDSLSILLGNGAGGVGDGSFALSHKMQAGDYPQSIAVADFDEDDILDLVVVNAHDDNAQVFLGNGAAGVGDGTFQAPVSYGVADGPHSVIAVDVNDDDILDLVAPGWNSDNVAVLLGNGEAGVGDGTFQPRVLYPVGDEPRYVIAGDWSGDGVIDLATGGYGGMTVTFLVGNGDGTFQSAQSYDGGGRVWCLAAGHFNGDTHLDVVTANPNLDGLLLMLGRGDGTLRTARNAPLGGASSAIASGDFNRDGALDVVVPDRTANTVTVLTGDDTGAFLASGSFPCGSGPNDVAVIDGNGDGILDLITANSFDDDLTVLIGNGSNGSWDGTFQAPSPVPLGGAPAHLTVGDWNGDGINDLAAAHFTGGRLSVLIGGGSGGVGDGTFSVDSAYTIGIDAYAVTSGDFDGDEIADLATVSRYEDSVTVLLGGGDGMFSLGGRYATGDEPYDVGAYDLDGDDILDLITADRAAGTASVLFGNGAGGEGDGTFAAPEAYVIGGSPYHVAVAEMDGDGDPDLLITNNGDGRLSILRSAGGRAFMGRVDFGVGQKAVATVVGNFDRSGEWDMVVVGTTTSRAEILLNKTEGIFASVGGGAPAEADARTLANRPNPFNPSTRFGFRLERTGPVLLQIFDPGGRLVRVWRAEGLAAGDHEFRWNGEDQSGRPVGSGLYLTRLEAGGSVLRGKAILVR